METLYIYVTNFRFSRYTEKRHMRQARPLCQGGQSTQAVLPPGGLQLTDIVLQLPVDRMLLFCIETVDVVCVSLMCLYVLIIKAPAKQLSKSTALASITGLGK